MGLKLDKNGVRIRSRLRLILFEGYFFVECQVKDSGSPRNSLFSIRHLFQYYQFDNIL